MDLLMEWSEVSLEMFAPMDLKWGVLALVALVIALEVIAPERKRPSRSVPRVRSRRQP